MPEEIDGRPNINPIPKVGDAISLEGISFE